MIPKGLYLSQTREELKVALDKGIRHHKEHRKQYKGSKAFSKSCRNHGGCDYCKSNRLYHSKKALNSALDKVDEYENEETKNKRKD